MVKTRTSRDQADLPDNEEPSRSRATSKNDQQAEHPTNGFQSDSSHEEQFMSRKRRRSYHEDSEDSSRSIRHRLRRVRRNRSPPMRSSSHRYYERESLKLRTRSRDSLGIRRSTRQKKLRYETYDQNLIEKQFSMMDRDSEDEMSPREISTRRRQAQKYISQDEESDDEEEDDDEEERSVKMKTRRGSDDALEKHNDEEADENKDTANREEGGRMLLRKGRKRAEVAEEEMEDGEQPKRSHKRMEVEPMPEAEALDMYTRVKRERPRVKRDMYGIPINDDDEKDDKSTSDSETEVDRIDEDTDDNDERNKEKTAKKKCYNLRLQCRKTNLYSAPPIKPQRSHRRSLQSLGRPFQSLGSSTEDFRSPIRRRRKRAAFHSSTSSSSATDDEAQFERRKSKSMAKARQRCLPMNLTAEDVASGVIRDRGHSGASLADVEPMAIDKSVLFDSIGGLAKHLQALKEMIVFPLIYPEVFTRFKITPPRGVLFHGPPGTGKTLVARALANECSQGDTKVAFFMRKGADCLSKWVGESERQLRLLFDQAYQMRPAIIFFDEIDGLAPVRSSRQDQIHSSIVSTLLALMDGLDDRGEVVVIGATNRIDSIDPALRRPGRFDREFLFPLPTLEARKQILQIHTKEWNPALSTDFVADLARRTVGYCGADVKALCTEAALHALRRRYPQIYNSRDKLLIDVSSINIRSLDFYHAMDRITPTAQRSASSPAKALGEIVRPLLKAALGLANSALQRVFPSAFTASASHGIGDDEYSDDDLGADVINQEGSTELRATMHQISSSRFLPPTYRPRLLLAGDQGQGQSSHLGPALLHQMENLAVNVVDLPALLAVGTRTPEESCAQIIREARRNIPSILYLPHVNELWDVIGDVVRAMLLNLLGDLDPSVPLLLLATCETQFERLPSQVRELFRDEVIVVPEPDEAKRREFFENLLLHQVSQLPVSRRKTERKVEVLPKAPKPEPRKLTEEEQGRLYAQEETTLRELRLFLRDVINKLGRDRKFSLFAKPVDREEVPDYYDIIKNPMDLSTMMTRIDLHKYETVAQFLLDIDLICSNALEYNPDKDPQDRAIRHRACALKDTTNAIIAAELDLDFGLLCEDIARARKNRNFSVKEVPVPSYYFTKPLNPSTSAANDPADGCPATVGRRTRSHSTNESSSSATVVAEPLANADTQKKPDKDNSFPRRVVKRIRFCRPRKTTGFKSPWCRTSKPIYKKVVVYVDRNGKEIPESEYKKALADRTCNVSVTCENLKETCSSESIGQCKSDGLKSANAEGSCGPATRCQGKRRSSVEAPEDGGRPAANEISKVSPVSNNKQSLSVNHASPVPESSQTRSTTDESSLSPDKASPGPPMAHDHQTRKAVQTLAKMLKTVVTDPSRQRNLLDETVQRTRGFSVERLEKLHSQLSLCVYRHRNEYNKMQLLKDLESVIGSISTVRPPNHHRP